jgi:hypothetical protein
VPDGDCWKCHETVRPTHRLACATCARVCHWQCYCLPTGLFPSRLKEGLTEGARWGDTRRPDFGCPRCHFEATMRRAPVEDAPGDAYLLLCEVQTTLDEFHKDSAAYSTGCLYTLRQVSRWGRDLGVPCMIAGNRSTLEDMPLDHRQLAWYFVDQGRTKKWATVKKQRSSIWNYYQRMGIAEDDIPTSNYKFTHRMNGLLQRLGNESKQDLVFSEILLADLVALLKMDYLRARGARRAEMALVNLGFHAYTQMGCRANELFEEVVGRLEDSFIRGDEAKRKHVREHLTFRATQQTKTERFVETNILCSWRTKHSPLRTGMWAELAIAELRVVGRGQRDTLLFAHGDGSAWRMGWYWDTHIVPRLEQLQRELAGGLERVDLDLYGTNSFRRTWNTLAGQHPDPVSIDLRERQARWRTAVRRSQAMSSLYFDPKPNELLLATYNL